MVQSEDMTPPDADNGQAYKASHSDPITREIREDMWMPRGAYPCGCNHARLCPQHAAIRAAEHYHPELIP